MSIVFPGSFVTVNHAGSLIAAQATGSGDVGEQVAAVGRADTWTLQAADYTLVTGAPAPGEMSLDGASTAALGEITDVSARANGDRMPVSLTSVQGGDWTYDATDGSIAVTTNAARVGWVEFAAPQIPERLNFDVLDSGLSFTIVVEVYNTLDAAPTTHTGLFLDVPDTPTPGSVGVRRTIPMLFAGLAPAYPQPVDFPALLRVKVETNAGGAPNTQRLFKFWPVY